MLMLNIPFTSIHSILFQMWQKFKYQLRKGRQIFDLWSSHLTIIEGCFGTSVASYFIFLKWVLLLNIPIFLLTFGFLVIPQILYRYYQLEPSGYDGNEESFSGTDLLTGSVSLTISLYKPVGGTSVSLSLVYENAIKIKICKS